MKNKAKKASKPGPKKEIKRPAHKKPRPRKYVEAKIPDRPPVPTEQIPITKEFVKFEIPKELLGPQTSEERFVELLNKAAGELKDVADNLAKTESRHPLPETVYYKTGGIGAILRLETGADEYRLVEKIAEELKREATRREVWQAAHDVVEAVEDYNPEPVIADPNDEMLQKVIHIKEVAAEQKSTPAPIPPKQNWFVRAIKVLLGK